MFVRYKGAFILIIVWICMFMINMHTDLVNNLASKGINKIGVEYYRFITGSLLHVNTLHLLANTFTMFYVGSFLEPRMGSVKMGVFILCATFISNLIFSCIYKNTDSSIGGSICIFAAIGLIIGLQLFKPDFPRFRLGTAYGNWILIYSIVGNIPIMSFMNHTTVVIHGISLITGFIIGGIGIFLRLL